MNKLKPQTYLDLHYAGVGYTTKTVISWIKRGKIRGKRTPTSRWLVPDNAAEE